MSDSSSYPNSLSHSGFIVSVPAPPAPVHVCSPPVDAEFSSPVLPDTDPEEPAPVGTVWECYTCHHRHTVEPPYRTDPDRFRYWQRETDRQYKRRYKRHLREVGLQ